MNTEQAPIVVLRQVGKSYFPPSGTVAVLEKLDLTAEQGQSVAITGPSGSGKTTLINLIAGLDKPDEGTITISGKETSACTLDELDQFRSRHVGIVFQHHHLLPQCTALENVLLPTLPLRGETEKALDRALELLERVGLSDRADHFPSQLSGGERQRVAVARALINSPELLLADEPTGSLNREQAHHIVDLLCQFVDSGSTLIAVTHAEHVAAAMSRQLTLLDGRLSEGSP